MESTEILEKLKQAVPGGILEKSRFGRSSEHAIWVEAKALPEIARFLKCSAEIALDWLENLSVIQMDDALVASYFLRSFSFSHTLIARVSVVPPSNAKAAELPSVIGAWKMAGPFEAEISELFGIRFKGGAPGAARILPPGWSGFPLRKNYVFPTEFLGISHLRRAPARRGDA